MKKFIFLLTVLITTISVAQQGINYKAIVKDGSGNVVAGQNIDVKFSIIEDAGATVVYAEEHLNKMTDDNGIIILNIGEGTPVTNTFASVAWGSETHSLKTEIDIEQDTSFEDLGTTQFMAVPYALHAMSVDKETIGINDLSDAKSDNDGSQNGSSIFLGLDAGANDDGTNNGNVGVGYQALNLNTTGVQNTANGYQALSSNTTGSDNTANGYQTLFLNTTGGLNTANGNQALQSNTTGSNNTANGYQALQSNTTGALNTANGNQALNKNTTGIRNTANGNSALASNTTGSDNTANGYSALLSNTTGINNTANGNQALILNTTGSWNTANGYKALNQNTEGARNTANGGSALHENTTGNNNTANGDNALISNTTGSNNTVNGAAALSSNVIGSGNVALGYEAGFNEIGDNTLYIANTNTTTPLIYGEFDNKKLTINGDETVTGVLSVGTTTNSHKLTVLADTDNQALRLIGNDGNNGSGARLNFGDGDYAYIDEPTDDNLTIHASTILMDGATSINGTTIVTGALSVSNNIAVSGTLAVSGAVVVNSVVVHSDRRLKKDIEALPYGLKEILQLQPKAYNWKARTQAHKSLGLIAQDVQPLIKEIVIAQNNAQKTLGINYTELIPVLINAIQEQQELIETQNLKISDMSAELQHTKDLEQRIKQIERVLKTTNLKL